MKQPGPTRHRVPVLAPLALALVLSACSGGGDGGDRGPGSGSSSSSLPDCIPGTWLIEVDPGLPGCGNLGAAGIVATASVVPGASFPDVPGAEQEGFALEAPGWEAVDAAGQPTVGLLYLRSTLGPTTYESAGLLGRYYLPAQDVTVEWSSIDGGICALDLSCDELCGSGSFRVYSGRWIDDLDLDPPLGALLCVGSHSFYASRVQGMDAGAEEHEAPPVPVSGLFEVEGSERPHPVRGVYDPELRVGEALVLGLEDGLLELIGFEEGGLVVRAASPRLVFAPAVGVGRGVSLAEGRLLLHGELSIPARLRLSGLEQSALE